jgi:hypothetical protein
VTIRKLADEMELTRTDLRHAQKAMRSLEREYTSTSALMRAELSDLKVGVHVYLQNVGRHGVGTSFSVALGALRSAVIHHPLRMAASAGALAALWYVCFRAHIARLKRHVKLQQPAGKLLNSECFADVELYARDGPPILAHACLLSTSPYFEAFLSFNASANAESSSGSSQRGEAARMELRVDEERRDLQRYLEWLYTGCVSEQHAEDLFVLADRMADTRLQLACSQQMMTVREDTSSWFALVGVASAAAAGVLVLAGKTRLRN